MPRLFPGVRAVCEELGLGDAAATRFPDGSLPVYAVGDLDGWGYLSMTRLHGEPLVAAWPRVSAADRVRLGTDLGAMLAELHAISEPELESVRVDWPDFLAR